MGAPAIVDVSRRPGNESEGSITVHPLNPQRLFAVSNLETAGLFAAMSSDGGSHWATRTIADGTDALPAACCDASVAYDRYGNLFLSYVNDQTNAVEVAVSPAGGFDFRPLWQFRGRIDQPTITAGDGMVWVTFQMNGRIVAGGAQVFGAGKIGRFHGLEVTPAPPFSNFGDIAIGPRGQVMVTYLSPANTAGPSRIYVNVDADGLGPKGFGPAMLATSTNVGGFKWLPAQQQAPVDAEPGLAFDRSGGPYTGRVYMVYTDALPANSFNTVTQVRYSDDVGRTWSHALSPGYVRGPASQLLPRIALDQATGNLAVSWYDTRGLPSTCTQFYGAIGRPGRSGISFGSAFRISRGVSDATRSGNAIDYGDYNGLAFQSGILHPIWFDNSNSAGANPDGARSGLDLYTTTIPVQG